MLFRSKSRTRLSDFTFTFHLHALEKEMETHSSVLAWRIPGMAGLEGFSPWGCTESDTTERLHFHFSLSCIGEGTGNPLQCSCLENPRDGGAWWAAVYRVTQSRTRLKRLSSSSLFLCHHLLANFVYIKVEIQSIPKWLSGKESTCNAGAAAAAKLHQSCPTLCDPVNGSPPRSPVPGILQARTLEWVAISFSNA